MNYAISRLALTSLFLFAAMALLRPHAHASPRTTGQLAHQSGRTFTSEAAPVVHQRDAVLARLADSRLPECAVDRPGEHVELLERWAGLILSLRRDGLPAKIFIPGSRNGNPVYTANGGDGTVESVVSQGEARTGILEASQARQKYR